MFLFTNKYRKRVGLMSLFLLVIAAPQTALALEGQGSVTGLEVQAEGPITANLQAAHVSESSIGPFHTTNEVRNVSLLDGDITASVIGAETIYMPFQDQAQNQVISLSLTDNLDIQLSLVPVNPGDLTGNLPVNPGDLTGNLPVNLAGAPLSSLNVPLNLLNDLINVPLDLISAPLDLISLPFDLVDIPLNSTDAPLNLMSLNADNITSAASINGLCGSLAPSGGAAFKNLTLSILDIPVTVPLNPAPNTELLNTSLELSSGTGDLVNATAEIHAIANEQIVSSDNSSITVNGLHIKIKWKPHMAVNGGMLSQDLDMVIAHSHAAFSGC